MEMCLRKPRRMSEVGHYGEQRGIRLLCSSRKSIVSLSVRLHTHDNIHTFIMNPVYR